MANTGQPNSAGSQYFITVEPTAWLNGDYAAFGHVTMGSDVVEAISEVPTDANDKPLVDVEIDSIRIMTPQFYGITPEQDTLYAAAGEQLVFGLLTNDPEVTFTWYIDEELQNENSFLLNVSLSVNGWHEIKGVGSKNGYDYEQIWWLEITGGTYIPDDLVNNSTTLYQNSPNPFNPNTTISFALDATEFVKLDIFNMKGQHIRSLVQAEYGAGIHSINWNGTDDHLKTVSSGIYFYRLQAGSYTETRRALLLK